jgi:two-component SAPR family response regulator
MASFEHKEYERASDDCVRALRLAPADAIDLQIQARFDLIQCFDALGRLERHSDLLSELEQRAERARDVATLSRYWYLRSKAHEAKLRHVASASACERALRCAQEAEDTETAALSQVRLGMMLACEGNYGEALKLVDAAREQARRAGYSRTMAYAVASVGDIERMRGAYDSAIAGYYRAQTLTEPLSESRLLAYVLSGLAYTYILNGRSDLAVSLLRDGYEQEPDPAESTGWARKALALGLAYLREGEPANAAEPIERAYALAPSADDPSLQLDARLILSALLLAQRRDAEANAEIAAALNALAVEDVVPVLLPTVQTVSEILPLIERSRGERAAALLAALARVERSRSREEDDQSSPTAPDMRLFAFGGARVFDGRVQVGGWRLPAALELMCYLLDRQEPVAKETILADLWPGKTEQNANLNFRQAVFQLNRTLERKTVVKRDRRWTLAFDCWVDTREFERLYMEGVRMEDAGDARSAQCAFRRALTYYCGPYLADVDSPWALQRAEEFASTYRSCLDRLAALEEQFGRYEDAAQRWFQLLASAASHESARRGLMRHYARQREYENARDQYARLRHALGPERAPTAETQALYDELVTPATAHDA